MQRTLRTNPQAICGRTPKAVPAPNGGVAQAPKFHMHDKICAPVEFLQPLSQNYCMLFMDFECWGTVMQRWTIPLHCLKSVD